MDMRLTLQVIEQLGLDPTECRGSRVEDLAERHELLRMLVDLPWSSSEERLPGAWRNTFYLHRGQWCLLARYDEEHGILWLCHVGSHQGEHSVTDTVLGDSSTLAWLLPTREDFLDLEPDPTAFVLRLFEVGSTPVERAHANPGQEIVCDLAQLSVRIRVENVPVRHELRQQTWLIFSYTPESAELVAVEWVLDWIPIALGVLLPDVQRDHLRHRPNDPRARNVIATFLWRPWEK
jgi:hypothetical protein